MISPELENDKLQHNGPFYICGNCGQLLTKELENKGACPNCEFNYDEFQWVTYAVSEITALWWLMHTINWLKTKQDIGIDLIMDIRQKMRWIVFVEKQGGCN